jgi:hypothetical protein
VHRLEARLGFFVALRCKAATTNSIEKMDAQLLFDRSNEETNMRVQPQPGDDGKCGGAKGSIAEKWPNTQATVPASSSSGGLSTRCA